MSPDQEAELGRLINLQATVDPDWRVLLDSDEIHYDDNLVWLTTDEAGCARLAVVPFRFEITDMGRDPTSEAWDGMKINANRTALLAYLTTGAL